MLQNLSSAAVVIGALSVEQILLVQPPGTAGWIKSYQKQGDLWWCAINCTGLSKQIIFAPPPGTAGEIKSYQKRGDLWWCAIKCMGSIMVFLYVKQLPVSSAT